MRSLASLAGVALAMACICSREHRPTAAALDTIRPSYPDSAFQRGLLRIILHVPGEATTGRPVRFAVTIKNQSGGEIEVRYGGPPQFIVKTERGEEVWNSFDGEAMSASMSVRHLSPGDSLEFNAIWSALAHGEPMAPGEYEMWLRAPAFTQSGLIVVGPRRFKLRAATS